MCKGKGVVTLRATLIHIDDEGQVTEKPNVFATPGEWEATAEAQLRHRVCFMRCKVAAKSRAFLLRPCGQDYISGHVVRRVPRSR